ncbi:MAG TPA: hypothetical protein VIM58_01340 [Candidatus Methylacidiphilales bacterium]
MAFDLRFPIGILFSLAGLVLVTYGAATGGSDLYARSLGINVNLVWGGVLLVFGLTMLALAIRARKK